MRARQRTSVGLAAMLVAFGLAAAAMGQAKEAALPVAVLNLDVLFKEDAKVASAVEDLKQQALALDEKVKLRQTELEAVQDDARKAQPGSAEQRRLQQELFKLNAELQQFVARERASVQTKEAKIYLGAYRDIEAVVKGYCKEKGIKLVIRQQTTSLDENQAAPEILKALNRMVIFEDGLDITADIQERLKMKDK